MLLVVTSPSYDPEHPAANAIATKMLGVSLAAASSGGGEITFLAMTHYYGPFSLAGWGSGTGAAGLVGAGAYALATTGLGLSSRGTLFASAFLPLIMVGSFFLVLPLDKLKHQSYSKRWVGDPDNAPSSEDSASGVARTMEGRDGDMEAADEDEEEHEDEALLRASTTSTTPLYGLAKPQSWTSTLRANITQMRHLFIP